MGGEGYWAGMTAAHDAVESITALEPLDEPARAVGRKVSGHLGGHLAFAKGVGVDQTSFEDPPQDWTAALRDGDLPEGESRYAEVEGAGVLVARHRGGVYALSNRCVHRGGALDEGELSGGCVTCPRHGSTYRLADGGVERGPAAYPQPAWQVRVRDGVIELKPPV
jgi:nitrite reductase/ring-hydroxylating ferredoxin subunit